MILTIFTLTHVVISLVGILSGVVVLLGLLTGKGLDGWTSLFLATTILTSVTGFFFPVDHFMPSHAVGILSLILLSVAIYSRYGRQLAGAWRGIYVVGAVASLYLNVFVAIVQAFSKVPALKALAPTQSEPPFKIMQLVALAIFLGLGIVGVKRFRTQPQPTTSAT